MWGRYFVVLALLSTWVATPAIACLPSPQMTKAEMDCCKKMAGNCNMGAGKHPCCKTVSTAPIAVASISATVDYTPVFILVDSVSNVDFDLRTDADESLTQIGLPPPAPPGTDSILRI